jgi:hypothetical protein
MICDFFLKERKKQAKVKQPGSAVNLSNYEIPSESPTDILKSNI